MTTVPRVLKFAAAVALIPLLLFSSGRAQENMWVTKAPLPVPLTGMEAGDVDGKLYVAGGFDCTSGFRNDTFAYDPKTNTWESRAPMPTPRDSAASAVVDGILYVIGGNFEGPVGMVEAYNPKTDTWTAKAGMPTKRTNMTAGVIGGLIYVVGGSRFFVGALATLEAYDAKTDTWTTKAPMPTPRYGAAAGAVDGIFYVAGGAFTGPGAGPVNVLEAYDPKTDTWSTRAPAEGRRWSVGAVLDRTLYVAGGSPRDNDVLAYDPKTDSWISKPPLPTGRFSAAAGVIVDVLYVVGGQLDPNRNPHPCLAVNEAFSPFLFVGVDIKPGEAGNTINLKSGGVVSVAILGSATFDPLTVDPETVTLAGASVSRRTTRGNGLPMTSTRDANHDGYPDLVLFFRTQDLQLTPASTEAVLYGTTFSGQRLRGADSVRLVPLGKISVAPARSRAAVPGRLR